ncbi:hypothetical protein [Rhodoferax sp.]|uniref:hypothetical protein n=1 Tax=Rhodoferax sp. TaxID=50421 RepID=UPI002ACE2E2D|nr:hypothetical protein [Rhodoferax sp.]MDZ7918506.1 hypothetical protein [Rhodoferax sp.]
MSIDQGQKAENAQKDATAQAKVTAAKTADQADQANNRANGKQPDIAGIASANEQAAKGGISGTVLTGPTGIDPKQLMLGKSTLLGG